MLRPGVAPRCAWLQVFIDTTGWAFGYPLAWRAGCKVACYVHYPTISSDMLGRVWSGTATYNNDAAIAGGRAAQRRAPAQLHLMDTCMRARLHRCAASQHVRRIAPSARKATSQPT